MSAQPSAESFLKYKLRTEELFDKAIPRTLSPKWVCQNASSYHGDGHATEDSRA